MQELHPCYSLQAHMRYARIHLPVCRGCNLGCNYCERLIGGPSYHSYRPAVCDRVISPPEAISLIEQYTPREELKVAGIAGPGEPLFDQATFQTLRLVGLTFPDLILCLSTNGLLLPDYARVLAEMKVSTLTVTVNTLEERTARKIYSHVLMEGNKLTGARAAQTIVARQIAGVQEASDAGIRVKINTVLIPGVNDKEIGSIARASREAGASIQNIVPLIPLGRFRDRKPASCEDLIRAREAGMPFIDQFTWCRQCRADSAGVPGLGDGRHRDQGKPGSR
jgi:nitrogen fixation protein NifB